jgi:hypothetical protein
VPGGSSQGRRGGPGELRCGLAKKLKIKENVLFLLFNSLQTLLILIFFEVVVIFGSD